MTIKINDICYLDQTTDITTESINGGIVVYAPPGIDPDGDPTTPPGNSNVTRSASVGITNPAGNVRGFAKQSPGKEKNGVAYDFDPVTGTFNPL
jgi:hypothetical protein